MYLGGKGWAWPISPQAVVKSGFYLLSKAGWGIGPGHWREELSSADPPASWADGARTSSPE